MVTQEHNKNSKATPRAIRARKTVRLRPLSAAIHIAIAGGLTLGVLPGGLYAALPDPAAAWVRQANPERVSPRHNHGDILRSQSEHPSA